MENDEKVRKNEGKPMKNQGKIMENKEKVRKPCPRPKKNKIPKTRKKKSPKNSAPLFDSWWILQPQIEYRRITSTFAAKHL